MNAYQHTGLKNRLNNALPKIGIRAIIDGRRNGVREAIEPNTIAIANLTAKLISENLRYSNGLPVEVIVSETTIGGVAEAVRCDEYFRKQNVGAVIDISYAFAYASESMVMDPLLPRAVWGFNGSQRPGSIYLAAATALAEQKGFPVFKIYGHDVQDMDDISIPEDVRTKILLFAKCSTALAEMKGKSYLSMGGVCMGIGASIVDSDFFYSYLGMRVEYIDMTEFVRRIEREIYDRDEYKKAIEWARVNCQEMDDPNPAEKQESRERKDKNWETVVKMALIAKDLMTGNSRLAEINYKEEAEGHNAIAAGFQGQRQWTDHFPNADFMEAISNSSFDWNGIRQPYILSTENDSLNAVTMLWGHLLTGTAQAFCDVRTYWSPDAIKRVTGYTPDGIAQHGFIYLTNSGSAALDCSGEMTVNGKAGMKPHWEITSDDVEKCIKATKWGSGKLATFRGGGFSSSFKTRPGMPVTMIRLNLVKGVGPVLQLAEGYSIALPQDIEEKIIKRTDPTWPKTFFVPRLTEKTPFKDVYSLMNAWGSNHCSFSYGHIGKELITLSSMLRIPVALHNLDDSDIYRPTAWNSFGTSNMESADFMACRNYGPVYKTLN